MTVTKLWPSLGKNAYVTHAKVLYKAASQPDKPLQALLVASFRIFLVRLC